MNGSNNEMNKAILGLKENGRPAEEKQLKEIWKNEEYKERWKYYKKIWQIRKR